MKFMQGTEGAHDYLVIYEDPRIKLGVKPLLGFHEDKKAGEMLVTSLRVRLMPVSGVLPAVGPLEGSMYDQINKWPWSKRDEVRWSFVVNKFHKVTKPTFVTVLTELKDTTDVLSVINDSPLNQMPPEWYTESIEDIATWLTSEYTAFVNYYLQRVKQAMAQSKNDKPKPVTDGNVTYMFGKPPEKE